MSITAIGFFILALCSGIRSTSAGGPVVQILRGNGSAEAIPHSHPWLITMVPFMAMQMCGLSLIKVCESCNQSDILVTAAHCISTFDNGTIRYIHSTQLFGGVHNTSDWYTFDRPKHLQNTWISKMRVHPIWAEGNGGHDIAVVQSKKPFQFNKNITAVELPSPNYDTPVGSECKMAGWGKSGDTEGFDALQEMNITVVEDDDCLEPYGKYGYDAKTMMCCVASQGGNANTCKGDSGGPIVCRNDEGKPIAQGLLSFGEDCWKDTRSVYTAMGPYVDWVYKTAFEMTRLDKDHFLCKAAGVTCRKM